MDELDTFTKQFTNNTIPHTRIRNEYYTPGNPPTTKARLEYMTTRLGRQQGKNFIPSIPLLDWIAQQTNKTAVLNDKASWLFICGRNALKEGITKNNTTEGLVIVTNEKKEVLGYGKNTGAGITNLLDRGDYLRRER